MHDLLLAHSPSNDVEAMHLSATLNLIENHPDCYVRTHFNPGHITGSALLISADGNQVLMNHHRFLDKWLSFGGHADGERDILAVARREIIEESGVSNIEPLVSAIVDVDV